MGSIPEVIEMSSEKSYKELRFNYVINLLKSIGLVLLYLAICFVFWFCCLYLYGKYNLISLLFGYFGIRYTIKLIGYIKDTVIGVQDVKLVNRSLKKWRKDHK